MCVPPRHTFTCCHRVIIVWIGVRGDRDRERIDALALTCNTDILGRNLVRSEHGRASQSRNARRSAQIQDLQSRQPLDTPLPLAPTLRHAWAGAEFENGLSGRRRINRLARLRCGKLRISERLTFPREAGVENSLCVSVQTTQVHQNIIVRTWRARHRDVCARPPSIRCHFSGLKCPVPLRPT